MPRDRENNLYVHLRQMRALFLFGLRL